MTDRLYKLLPAIHRIRDAEHGQPLRALLGVMEEQLEQLEQDISGLYDDWFIETCDEWLLPYIGDLLGVRLLNNIDSGGVYSQRALVANTISHRRRKGTLLMLEDLARDVTGWSAHAVAFFEHLGWTQNLNHLRYDFAANPNPRNPDILNPAAVNRVGSVNLRSLDVLDRIDGAFDETSHTVDVRPPGQLEGWHNIRHLGLFLWRLQSFPLSSVRPRPSLASPEGFHFSPLGNPQPLFTNPRRKSSEQGLATEFNVPGPIRPVAFFQDRDAFYGAGSDMSLAVYSGDSDDPAALIPPENILCKDLSGWASPPSGMVAVDPKLGRLAFAPGEVPAEGVTVDFHYGFSAAMGAGPYDRRESIEEAFPDDWEVIVAQQQPNPLPAEWRTSVAAAIADWDPLTRPRAVITIADNGFYPEVIDLNLGPGQQLIIQAADRRRPVLAFRDLADAIDGLDVSGGNGEEATLVLDGLRMEGAIRIAARSLGQLTLRHCTLVPGIALNEEGRPQQPNQASLSAADDNPDLNVEISYSICGTIRLPELAAGLTVRDSILDRPEGVAEPDNTPRVAIAASDDGADPGPATVLERTTVFGEVHVLALTLASEVLFTRRVMARRRQVGCVRYSYIESADSVTPRRFRCQPGLALENRRKQLDLNSLPQAETWAIRARVRPGFTAVRYGFPGYAQLNLSSAPEITTGAESGAEMGAFEHLKQAQRQANLRIRLQEYLPYGLEAGEVFVT
ncbi:MAG: hypothetical protein AAFY29_07945 [Pseudomonadota bacterium]